MSAPSAFTSQLNGLMLSVTPENVLKVRDTLKSEARRLQFDYDKHNWNASHLPVLGPDPVSGPASAAFNSKLPGVVNQFKALIDEVKATVDTLTETARDYGLTEGDIANAMHGIGSDSSGARQMVTDLATDPLAEQPNNPGAVANELADASTANTPDPAPHGVDADYMRRAMNPVTPRRMGEP